MKGPKAERRNPKEIRTPNSQPLGCDDAGSRLRRPLLLLFLLLHSTLHPQLSTSFAQGTAFTYQGRLNDGSSPATGIYDLRLTIYDAAGGAGVVAGPVTNVFTSVSNGLFAVALDFGASVFTGAERWLESAVRTNGSGAFTTLAPRQKILPSPYALYSFNAGSATGVVAGAIGTNELQNSAVTSAKIADGAIAAADVNAATFSNTFWKANGNAGTVPGSHFLGTTDSRALELKVNNVRALRLEPMIGVDGIVNIIGGPSNSVGGSSSVTIMGGQFNDVGSTADASVIGGGSANSIGSRAFLSTIAGGDRNRIADDGFYATIAGGQWSDIGPRANHAAVGGGSDNNIEADASFGTIAGGLRNTIGTNSDCAAIGGGRGNYVGVNSFAPGIAGGATNSIGTNADYSAIGGGNANTIGDKSISAAVAGGSQNDVGKNANYSVIGGGDDNTIGDGSEYSAVPGGSLNRIGTNTTSCVIGGGSANRIADNADWATIPGGSLNFATTYAFAAGRRARASHTGAFVWADSQFAEFASSAANQFLIRAAGGVGINLTNPATALGVNGTVSASALGIGTTAPDAPLHVQSGAVGLALNSRTVLGLERIGDTWLQMITTTSNHAGLIFGSPYDSLDASLRYNNLGGRELAFRTLQTTRMVILTNGNVGIGNSAPTDRLMVVNARCDGSSWINASDRRLKQDFAPVDAKAMLEKVVALPVQQWSYRAQPEQKHVGPVAQDFRAAFGLGKDDTSIATVDADGVALAAIQGLNEKLEAENRELREQFQSLWTELSALRRLVQQALTENSNVNTSAAALRAPVVPRANHVVTKP